MSDASTRRLLRDAHSGDPAAVTSLLRIHLPWIAAQVRRRLSPVIRQEGETLDFVQDAVIEVLADGPRFVVRDPDHFRALMVRIVENNIRDRHRHMHRDCRDRRRRRAALSDSILELDPPVRSVTGPAERADRNEHLAWLQLAIDLLEPEDREIIRARQWEGLSFLEIGRALGVSEDAARKRHARALPKLAAKVSLLREGQVARAAGEDDPV